jgi:transposase
MVVIPGLSRLLEAAGKRVTSWDDSGSRLVVEAGSVVESAVCPQCACGSARSHGRFRRWVADNPCFGQPVTLAIEVRRFKCVNPGCPRRTFCERIETLVAAGRRRTLRLVEALLSLGYALGGEAAARLAARLGMRISGPTVLRELRRAGCPPLSSVPVVIGIDDWALARGHKYGTIVVDLEERRPIELLAERDAATVVPWLQLHPEVEVIARDRAGAYADAARTAAPDAQQVADRWHLLANLRDAIERLLLRCTGKLSEAARQASEALLLEAVAAEAPTGTADDAPAGIAAADMAPAEPSLRAWQHHSNARREHRLARYEEAVRRHQAGESIRAIGLAMNLDRRTVRSFVHADAFPERAQRARVPSLLDAHRQYLVARTAEGCRNAMRLWRELRARGFTGGRSIVRDAVAQLRGTSRDGGGQLHAVAAAVRKISPPSARRACAWVLGWEKRKLAQDERSDRRRFVETLCRIEPAIAEARSLALRFMGLVRRHDLDGFDRWLPQARACAVPDMQRFAAGLETDLSAVRAAFSSSWSSGQVEGQINRLKYLKRQMYGRAKLDLMRIRVLHPN